MFPIARMESECNSIVWFEKWTFSCVKIHWKFYWIVDILSSEHTWCKFHFISELVMENSKFNFAIAQSFEVNEWNLHETKTIRNRDGKRCEGEEEEEWWKLMQWIRFTKCYELLILRVNCVFVQSGAHLEIESMHSAQLNSNAVETTNESCYSRRLICITFHKFKCFKLF